MRSVVRCLLLCLALLLAALVAGGRWHYESAMTELVPTDAQNGIWIFMSAAICMATFVACFAFLCVALFCLTSGKKHRMNGVVALCAFLFVSGCTGNTLREHSEARRALADAAAATTSAERLRELIGFQSGFGYEVDNRIASNPNATEDILRTLSAKRNHGTLFILARNPNTPEDVILELAQSPDEMVRNAATDRARKIRR